VDTEEGGFRGSKSVLGSWEFLMGFSVLIALGAISSTVDKPGHSLHNVVIWRFRCTIRVVASFSFRMKSAGCPWRERIEIHD
jgi:hypothetical protein